MNEIPPINRVSVAPTERSVNGPHITEVVDSAPWINSDQVTTPRNVMQALAVTPAANAPRYNQTRPEISYQPKPSKWRQALAVAGIVVAIGATVGGLVSMVSLGPFALAIVAGGVIVGAAMMHQGTKG